MEMAKTLFHFDVEKVGEQHMDVMFASDPGDETVRKTVHIYRWTRRQRERSESNAEIAR